MVAADYTLLNDWGAGFQGGFALTNDGATPTTTWRVSFRLEASITQIWGAQIVSRTGDLYVVESLPWNAVLGPGGGASFGFLGDAGGPRAAVTNIAVDALGDDTPPALPAASIADIVVDEDGGTALVTITLDRAAVTATSVQFATDPGTAGGADFTAVSRTVTFGPGATSATVAVPIADDATPEGAERFTVRLSDPRGLTLADGSATVTINSSDAVVGPPTITLPAGVAVTEGDPAVVGGGAAGWLSTRGSDIVDSDGDVVRITGVNWFGAETTRKAPDGLDVRNYRDMMDQMQELGFNAIRLPFSNEALRDGAAPSNINAALNPDLAGLSSLEVIDRIVAYAGEIGLRIILDNHRSAAGDGPSANGLWYGEGTSQEQWIADWAMLAERYKDDPTVVGFDLKNEPFNATWGSGNLANDWRLGAESAIEAIHAVNPEVLAIVEGIGGDYWWGGNLKGVATAPIRLDETDKLVYSPHDYPNSIYEQPWFSSPDFPDNLPAVWDRNWGYIAKQDIAPVLLGEFGSRLQDPKDIAWLDKLIPYLTENGLSFTFWSWNPNSGDTGGILKDDWRTVDTAKLEALEPALGDDLGDSGGDGGPAVVDDTTAVEIVVQLSAAHDEAVIVDWMTRDDTAIAGSDYEAARGTLTFAPGETARSITVTVLADTLEEGDETFAIVLGNPRGGDLARSSTTVTIRDDDGAGGGSGDPGEEPEEPGDPDDADGVTAAIAVRQSWGNGFLADGAVRNASSAAIEGWAVEVTTAADITNIWNAEILSVSGDTYVIGNVGYNARVDPAGEAGWGFQASGSPSGLVVSDVFVG